MNATYVAAGKFDEFLPNSNVSFTQSQIPFKLIGYKKAIMQQKMRINSVCAFVEHLKLVIKWLGGSNGNLMFESASGIVQQDFDTDLF